jgi:hypothetical protein
MAKKLFVLAVVLSLTAGMSAVVLAEETGAMIETVPASAAAETSGASVSVGGHIKLTVFDHSSAINRNGSIQTDINRTYGITFKELDLFLSGKVNEWLGFEVDPRFSQSTGATPKMGTTYTAAASGFSFSGFGHGKAVVTFELPGDIHMEVGQIHPIFTMEYGKELWWEDEFNVGPFVGSHGPAGAYHDTGIELNKSFDFGDISLPVYLDYTNGNSGSVGPDNNNQPGGLIHIEPVWGPLTIGASFYANRPDAGETKLQYGYTGGINFKWEGLIIRAEYARGVLQDGVSAGRNEVEEGYFAKVLYKVTPWLQLMMAHESDMDFIGEPGKSVRTLKYAPGFQVFITDSTIVEGSCDIEEMKMRSGAKGGVFTRPSVNLRLTF